MLCLVIGTRPEIIKMAPIIKECEKQNVDYFILHTGQHFSFEMDKLLQDLPETITGTLKGSIYAKADKMDQNVAIEFIESKVEDKTIDEETAESLSRLVRKYCTYR